MRQEKPSPSGGTIAQTVRLGNHSLTALEKNEGAAWLFRSLEPGEAWELLRLTQVRLEGVPPYRTRVR